MRAGAMMIAVSAMGCNNGSGDIEHGEYLVKLGDCIRCHTPQVGGEPDMDRLMAGHPADMDMGAVPDAAVSSPWFALTLSTTWTAWGGSWGIVYTANLTSHETGLGLWTEEMFIDMMRTGRELGEADGRELIVMPIRRYEHLTDEDLSAIFAYLQSLPPQDNVVPAYEPPE